jgi:hypothetical protein
MLLVSTIALLVAQADRPIVVESERLVKDGATMVCKQRPPTNTRFAKRTCHTRAEWDSIAEQNRRAAEEMVGGMKNNPCSADGLCDAIRGQ